MDPGDRRDSVGILCVCGTETFTGWVTFGILPGTETVAGMVSEHRCSGAELSEQGYTSCHLF